MAESLFKKASDAQVGGVAISELENTLAIYRYLGTTEVETKEYGTKTAVIADVYVVQGAEEGSRSKMPPQQFGAEPAVLTDRTGEVYKGVYIFSGFVRGAFRGRDESDLVLGRLVCKGMITSISKNDKDLRPSWVLEDPTADEEALAMDYWTKQQFKAPSGPSEAPAGSADAEAALDGGEPPF